MGTQVAKDRGYINDEQAASINRTAVALEKTFTDITPEQEYYIGRAVAASILKTYPAADAPAANAYLNELGQALAMASDRPQTFDGYHFLLLDSEEVNAFAAPGGLVLITRGLVRCCRSEDALAAVLAHEIGHVQGKHGLRAIKNTRLTSALTILSVETAQNFGTEDLQKLTTDFEGSITDVTQMVVTSGYARGLEKEADEAAITIVGRVGYDPRALVSMLEEMGKRVTTGGPGFGRTHPSPRERIEAVGGVPAERPAMADPAARRARFTRAVGAA
jgi:predicted Zn-dependent protease